MEEKAELETCCPEIISDLPHRALVKGSGGFCLNDQLFIDEHVQTLSRNFLPFVENRD